MERFEAELRAELSGNTLAGHAIVFGALAETRGHYEAIAPGAFDDTLKSGQDVKAFWAHDQSKVLGSTKAKTLRLWEDDRGLAFELDLPDTSYARDLRELVSRSDVSAMSFGFHPRLDTWSMAPDGRQIRTHTKAKRLLEVSPVALPAYEGTECYLRHMEFERPLITLQDQLIRLRAASLLRK